MTPEQLWDAFILHLNKVEPLKDGPHKNFLGGIDRYKRLFLEAAEEAYFTEATERHIQEFGLPDLGPLEALFDN